MSWAGAGLFDTAATCSACLACETGQSLYRLVVARHWDRQLSAGMTGGLACRPRTSHSLLTSLGGMQVSEQPACQQANCHSSGCFAEGSGMEAPQHLQVSRGALVLAGACAHISRIPACACGFWSLHASTRQQQQYQAAVHGMVSCSELPREPCSL